jgi:hypothetical protein
VQFVTTCFKIYVTERLQAAGRVLWKCDKHSPFLANRCKSVWLWRYRLALIFSIWKSVM